ncbi:MAG: hypothetical protein RBR40_09575 [Tenuifilaceae bacterium]|jgi:hypothetical protein|nr:hypothetical protein [Tenuifilaceae bacterium]
MNTTKVNLPSGRVFVIREQTGADDEILTTITDRDSGELEAIHKFLAGIVIGEYKGEEELTKVGLDGINNLLIRDKYALLIKARIFSLGNYVKFEYDFGEVFGKAEFVEDLNNYVIDYSDKDAKTTHLTILPYQSINPISIEVEDRHFVLDLLSSKGEIAIANARTPNINLVLTSRNLRVKDPNTGKYNPVINFSALTGRSMAIIRSEVRLRDYAPSLVSQISNPVTGETLDIPLLGIPDFFFPTRL